LGNATTVTLTSTAACPPEKIPLHVALVIDASDSMRQDAKLLHAKRAAEAFIDAMNFDVGQVAIVSFNRSATIRIPLTADPKAAKDAVGRITLAFGTDLGAGLEAGREVLEAGRPTTPTPDEPASLDVIVVLSDGISSRGSADQALAAAEDARQAGMSLAAVCLGADCDAPTMQAIASDPDLFFPTDRDNLEAVYARIAHVLLNLALREYVVRDHIPGNMRLDAESVVPSPADVTDGVITWRFAVVPTRGITLTYRLVPQATGHWPTNELALGVFRDSADRVGSVQFPVPYVDVYDPLLPTATPTPTATSRPDPTATPTLSKTATSWPSPASPTPSPSATPTRRAVIVGPPIYLPYAGVDRCEPSRRRTDVVLVLDASTSMKEPTHAGGPTKLVAAVDAAAAFLDALAFPQDRAAVVSFNASAELRQALTTDPGALRLALASIAPQPGTALDAGLDAAASELAAAPRVGVRRAVILLTDGQPTASSLQEVLAAGQRLKATDALVFTVGLGLDVNPDLLTTLATTPDDYFPSPGTADLVEIYQTVAELIPCP
jgi:Mg-chelatase subunit ChlD